MRSKIAPILEEARRGRPVYVEPFGGSAAMLLAITPTYIEVYNDADERLVDFFRALADNEALAKMKRWGATFPKSRAIYDEMKRDWIKSPELARRGFATFYVQQFSFGGTPFGSFGVQKKKTARPCSLGRIARDLRGLTNTRRGFVLRPSNRSTGASVSTNTIRSKRFFISTPRIAGNRKAIIDATYR